VHRVGVDAIDDAAVRQHIFRGGTDQDTGTTPVSTTVPFCSIDGVGPAAAGCALGLALVDAFFFAVGFAGLGSRPTSVMRRRGKPRRRDGAICSATIIRRAVDHRASAPHMLKW
jgi:hypothetical protein